MTPLTENQIREIVRNEMQANFLSGAPKVAPHNHDGNNNLKVQGINLINQPTYVYSVVFTQNTTVNMTIGQNPSLITCIGDLASNSGGSFYSTFTGIATIGNLLTNEASGSSTAPVNPTTLAPTPLGSVPIGITQSCNWFSYTSGTGASYAGTDSTGLIITTDSSSATLATGILDKLFTNSVELQVVVPSGFTLRVVFIIT